MIPEKDKFYNIKYIDPYSDLASYEGSARFTGDIEEDSDEQDLSKGFLYVFDSLERDNTFFDYAFFAEEDIIEEINITESDE
jgi:hypothetical protein